MINKSPEKEFLNSLLRTNFKSFVEKVFREVSPNDTYLDNWHIDVICHELMEIYEEKRTRLIINIPTRYMKSIICTVAFPAFILGNNPKASIITVSYGDELASNLALSCKNVMDSNWYRELFPNTRFSKSKKSIMDFETTQGGGRYSTTINGTLTGRGADYIIIDDPIKPVDALSDVMREKVNEWYGNTLYSRLNNKKTGKIILVMQRLHEDDLTGHILQIDNSYRHLAMPAIAEKDETWEVYDRISDRIKVITRAKGSPLHPERENLDMINKLRNQMGEYNFAGQYQQNPVPKGGGTIKRKWIKYYNPDKLFIAIDKGQVEIKGVIQSWDTASKIGRNNDFSACITILKDTNNVNYVVDVYRDKLEFPHLIKKLVEKHNFAKEKYRKKVTLLIEDMISGTALIQELKSNYDIYAKPIKPEYDKESRLISVSHLIENGKCLFPDNSPYWWTDFENELLKFPKTKHDDQCDALSQALSFKGPKIVHFDVF